MTELASCHARWLAVGGQLLREGGDERRAHGAFGEQIAHQVGDAEGDAKRVVGVAGAEVIGEDRVADQAEDAAGHRRQAEEAGGAGQARSGVGHQLVRAASERTARTCGQLR